jgi:hypothetical protein
MGSNTDIGTVSVAMGERQVSCLWTRSLKIKMDSSVFLLPGISKTLTTRKRTITLAGVGENGKFFAVSL